MKITLEELVKSYKGRRVVDGVSLDVSKGEVVGLLGANGAGKTTTFYMVVGLVKPDGGRVRLNEENISQLPMNVRAQRGIGYLAQETSIFRRLTVEENLRCIWEAHGMPRKEQERRLVELLKEFSLEHIRKNYAYTLSGGERRRVEIARALVNMPHFMLLDEPFTGVDPIAVAELQRIIRYLRDRGIGVLITDHNVRETLQIVDRAYIMREGRVLESGTAQYIAQSPIARRFYLGEHFVLGDVLHPEPMEQLQK